MIADSVLINLAIILSLAARILWIVATNKDTIIDRDTFWYYVRSYGQNAWLLTIISLVIFGLSGFYTYGRYYIGRYKILIVAQAVSLAYLVFGLLTYLTQGSFFGFLGGWFNLPRGVLVLSWAITIILLISARAWSTLWKKVVRVELTQGTRSENGKIENILVIGGAGYIGSALLPMLLEKGYHVRLLDLLLYGTEPIAEWLSHPRLEVMQADLRQIDKVVEAMRDMDAVIHLGGIVGDPACALDEELTLEINLMATRMIAEVAKGTGVRHFIFASTCSVYGASDHMLDERSELNPVSLYARSKIASEKVLLKMADDRFAPVILRLGTIYGLSGRTRFDLVINLLTAKAIVDGEITIYGGDQWRPFVHVDDAARSMLLVLEVSRQIVRNQIFNVGSNEQNYTIRQIGEIVLRKVPSAVIVNKEQAVDARNYWVNFNKIHRTLDFTPSRTVEQGIDQVIQAIQSGKVGDYRDAKYSNVKFLNEQGLNQLTRNENGWAYGLLAESVGGPSITIDG